MSVSQPQPRREPSGGDDCYVTLTPGALHDLVGPANQIRWMVDLILKKHKDELDEDDAQLFGFLNSSSERLQILVSGLRTYIRIVGQTQPYLRFDVNDVLVQAIATVRQAIEENDAVITHDPLPEVHGDPNQICSVLVNLLENSIKFRSELRPEVHLKATPENDAWVFSVRDNGIGIDPKHCDRIFEVFKRVHNGSYPGSGVGLAIAKRIIEQHGGAIWVDSQLGQGSTFSFRLPHTDRSAAHLQVRG